MEHPTHGTQLLLGDAYDVYTAIAQVITVTPPGLSSPPIPIVHHDLTGVKKKIPSALSDVGSVTARIYLDPDDDGHAELLALALSKEIAPWRITFPATAGMTVRDWDFEGYVGGYEPGEAASNDGVLEATITIEVTNTPALT